MEEGRIWSTNRTVDKAYIFKRYMMYMMYIEATWTCIQSSHQERP